jgi:DNA-binding CsgD family transcriptional regulator
MRRLLLRLARSIMGAEVVGRQAELDRIGRFLDSVRDGPAALVLRGEAGIGKTTLWQVGLDDGMHRGYKVLACRPAQSEARLSYSSVSDLFARVDEQLLRNLPDAQRQALEMALLRGGRADSTPDHRAIATAVLTVLGRLSDEAPVVLAVDDLQWLDRPSADAIEFVARRLEGPIGILASLRTEGRFDEPSALRVPGADRSGHLEIGPLSLGALHHLLKERTGRAYSRPALVRIQAASGGNPFFALELVRVLGERLIMAPSTRFSRTLAELARTHVKDLDAGVQQVLLAAAALATPTVELLRLVDPAAAGLLEVAEGLDIVEIDGARVRFTHPLLASGVYAIASAAQRRAMHRRLAGAGLDAEERARHLALAATTADEETIAALDAAALHARRRGAPAAAAELLELAENLGADDAGRRIRAAGHHFEAGDPLRARALLEQTVAQLPPGHMRAEAQRLLATVRLHDDSYREAAVLLEQALAEAAGEPAHQARIRLELLYVLTNLGRINDALLHVEPIIEEAERLGDPGLIAQALAASTIIRFLSGQGLDESRLQQALKLEDRNRPTAIMFRPSLIASLLWMWEGDLEKAREGLYALRRDCLEKGEESDLMFIAFHTVLLECWRGDLASAALVANDTFERALQLGTEVPRAIALSTQANAAAYAGEVTDAREAAEAAVAIFVRGSCLVATLWPNATLGFLELSQDDFEAAARRLGPMAAGAAAMGVREPVCVPFAADAAEALIALGQLEDATALVDQLEENGRRLDRAWALATGARCRGLLLAARGQLDAAIEAVERGLAEHERIPMPFERSRTLLVLGRLQRRKGRRTAARLSLEEALSSFDQLSTTLWAAKASDELRRLGMHAGQASQLTPSEHRVAELTASGLTNREVAAALLVSPKTVEANLARIYQKLGIRSRAELGQRMVHGLGPSSSPIAPS